MILSGQTIRRLCDPGTICGVRANGMISPFFERTIEELPDGRKLSFGLGPAGYDVRIEFDETGEDGELVLPPNGFLLASTIERFAMPRDVLGNVRDKSSWARRGLSVFNTVIEPGWRGFLTLELKNLSTIDEIVLRRGMAIAQITFERVDYPVERPYGSKDKYQDQGRGPQGPK